MEKTTTISLTVQSNDRIFFSQQLPQVDISSCQSRNQLNLCGLVSILRNQYNVPTQNHEILFYSKECGIFVNCGLTPVPQDIKIQKESWIGHLQLRVKETGVSHVHRLLEQGEGKEDAEEDDIINDGNNNKRIKERKIGKKSVVIGYIIDKVIKWRNFYKGVNGSPCSLDVAADKVNIRKKSLDDYLYQIRNGFNHGFNFNEHYNQKVGVLRNFVFNAKDSKSKRKNIRKNKK